MQSKALEKLIKEWGWHAAILEAHAIGYREGRRSRGKVVARGWAFGPNVSSIKGDELFVVSGRKDDKQDIPVEVVAKEVRRAKAK